MSESISLLSRLSKALLREPNSVAELQDCLMHAREKGLLDIDAASMIEGVIRVSDLTVDDVMVPRHQMVMLDAEISVRDALPIIADSAHSRLPVFDNATEKVVGVILAKDLLQYTPDLDHAPPIREISREATFIPDSKRLNILLREFRLKQNHMAIVIDEYGKVDGLVTIEDVLEQIVGDIEDEYDVPDNEHLYIKQIDTHIAEVDALTSIDNFNAFFETNLSDEDCDTIGGLMLQQFGHLPKLGETARLEDLDITVLEASDRGIKRLRIYRRGA